MQDFGAPSPGQEDRATHSSILARKSPRTEEPGGRKQSDMIELTGSRVNEGQ